ERHDRLVPADGEPALGLDVRHTPAVREESRESRDKARDNGHRPEGKATIVKVRTRASWTPFRSGTSWTSRTPRRSPSRSRRPVGSRPGGASHPPRPRESSRITAAGQERRPGSAPIKSGGGRLVQRIER